MTRWILCAACTGLVLSGVAQSQNGAGSAQPPPGNITSTNTAGSAGTSNLTLTNNSGGAFTVQQLGGQLQSLRTTVEQTLPMLTAFNARYSAAQPGTALGRAVQNIFSGSKNNGQGNTASQEITNVLSALGSLVSTNRQGSENVSPNTLRDLETLQKDLQPVAQTLQNLSFTTGTATNQNSAPVGGVPTPAGR